MAQQLNPKIIKWAKDSGNAQYLSNRELIHALYAENNKANRIADVMDGMEAEMKVMIVKHDKRPLRLCAGCKSKQCKAEKCGQEDYQTFNAYTILAGDQYDKVINLNFAPWYEGDIPEPNGFYLIKGKGRTLPVLNENTPATLEISVTEVVRELKEGEFKIKSSDEQESEEETTEAEETDNMPADEETEAEETPVVKKPIAKQQTLKTEVKSSTADPKLAKAIERVKSYFKVNDGARTPKQLQNFMTQQGIEKYYELVIKKLSLEKNAEGELEYVE